MPHIPLQGTLGSGSTLLYTCPIGNTANVNLKFNNPSAYTITLSRFDSILGVTTDVYTFNLAAGDFVIDNNNYFLRPSDSLTVNSSIAGTNYLITALEYL